MAEPLDLAGDLAVTRGIADAVQVRQYDPAADAHAAAVDATGFRGPKRVVTEAAGEGGSTRVTRADWTVWGLESRPTLNSLIVADGETWVVGEVVPNPGGGTVFDCPGCVLSG